jgi:hypothetical protein
MAKSEIILNYNRGSCAVSGIGLIVAGAALLLLTSSSLGSHTLLYTDRAEGNVQFFSSASGIAFLLVNGFAYSGLGGGFGLLVSGGIFNAPAEVVLGVVGPAVAAIAYASHLILLATVYGWEPMKASNLSNIEVALFVCYILLVCLLVCMAVLFAVALMNED